MDEELLELLKKAGLLYDQYEAHRKECASKAEISEEDKTKRAGLEKQMEKCDDDIKVLKASIERKKQLDAPQSQPLESPIPGGEQAGAQNGKRVHVESGTLGDKKFQCFSNIGEQLAAYAEAAKPGGKQDNRLHLMEECAAQNNINLTEGGILLQPTFSKQLLQDSIQYGQIAGKCANLPVDGGSDSVKISVFRDKDSSGGSVAGGAMVYIVDEGEDFQETGVTVGDLELKFRKAGVLVPFNNETLKRAKLMDAIVRNAVPKQLGYKLDEWYMFGDGAKQPHGMFNPDANPSLLVVDEESAQTASELFAENFIKLINRVPSELRSRAVIVHTAEMGEKIPLLTVKSGDVVTPLMLPPSGGLSGSPYGTIWNIPVIEHSSMAEMGDLGDLGICVPSEYYTIDDGQLEIAISIHVEFKKDRTYFRFIYHFDGKPSWERTRKPVKGTYERSPFVLLSARS